MAVQNYNVPVILSELRREETLLQVSDVLEYVEVVANDIFNRISNRVATERDKLAEINSRILLAQAKVDSLRSATSKATTVLSPPKYPASKTVEPYYSMFSDVDKRMGEVRYTRKEVESRMPDVSKQGIKDKKNFDLFKSQLNADLMETRVQLTMSAADESEGLGSLPEYLPSVASLLLFNTSNNPYKTYVFTDPLSGLRTKITKDKFIEKKQMEAAPISIQTGEELGRYQGANDVTYRPTLGQLPEMEVPNILNLPNVAENVLYDPDLEPSIAPSLAKAGGGGLPELDPSSGQPPPPPDGDSQLPDLSGAPPPPPPPPPVAPTPAPTLPTLGLDSDMGSSDDDDDDRVSTLPVVDDPRASLMEAIRAAGGTGLNKANKRKMKKKKEKEAEETVATGGEVNLMSDLAKALVRRRKGISGKQDREEKSEPQHDLGGSSMMNNISSLIPVTAPGSDSGTNSDANVDWEDTM
uniref:WASH n=1 Tax=Halisarca dujardinii TaxID=2583056 RepID=A0A9F1U4N7_HALDU|nr:WASH [Halisarca dujardinii]